MTKQYPYKNFIKRIRVRDPKELGTFELHDSDARGPGVNHIGIAIQSKSGRKPRL